MTQWSVYLVQAADQSLYTGIATDVARRLAEHERGSGARYLRGRCPLQLVYQQRVGDRSLALKVEHAIKQLPRAAKLALVASAPARRGLLALLAIEPAADQHQSMDHSRKPAQQAEEQVGDNGALASASEPDC